MASSPTTKVKCKPYFKLRSSVRHVSPQEHGACRYGRGAGPFQVPSLCAAYNWPTALPGNGVIAIVELGGGWVQSDMDTFFQGLNQPSAADHGCLGRRHPEQSQPKRRLFE